MADDERVVINAQITGIPHEDWIGRPGRRFRRVVSRLAKRLQQLFQNSETAQELSAMAMRRVEGEASGKYAGMLRDLNKSEVHKIDAVLRHRTIEEEISIRAAAARKAAAEATIAEIEAVERQLRFAREHLGEEHLNALLRTLRKHSVVIEPVSPGEFRLRTVHTFPSKTLEALQSDMRTVAAEHDEGTDPSNP